MQCRARKPGPGACGAHRLENSPGAAADFKITPRCWKEFGGEPSQQPAARFEPKMSGFVSREFIEDRSVETRLRVGQIRRIQGNAASRLNRMPTCFAAPTGRPERFSVR